MAKKKIGVFGATGFTGSELVRLLSQHEKIDIACITSESRAGEPFSAVHSFFEGLVDQELQAIDAVDTDKLDAAFLALPHGVSMDYVQRLWSTDLKLVDLSGDFRLDGPSTYKDWYHQTHHFPQGFESAVFGIPELFAADIAQARLVANPGCYPTGPILGISPLLEAGVINPSFIIIDAKSGVTGAGVKAKPANMFSNVNENFKAYGIKDHRHTIEIQQTLARFGGDEVRIQFTPHLLPVDRGILATMYLRPTQPVNEENLIKILQSKYEGAPFVRVRSQAPAIKDVRGTNYCDLFITFDERTSNIILISAIDNLIKGAAGQAIQNMNILFGWDQSLGLQHLPLSP